MILRRALAGGLFGLVVAAAAPMTAANAVPSYPTDETGGLTVSATVVAVGSAVTVSGDGYAADTLVTISSSTTTEGFAPPTGGLGSFRPATAGVQRLAAAAAGVTTDGSGAFSTSVTLNTLGLATITATGLNSSGGTRTLIATVEVVAAGSGVGGGGSGAGSDGSGIGGAGSLPDTGASVLLPVTIGGILLLAGVGLVTAVRRRKRGDATA
jgi:LPXTG-motif cell wall-anchored protein